MVSQFLWILIGVLLNISGFISGIALVSHLGSIGNGNMSGQARRFRFSFFILFYFYFLNVFSISVEAAISVIVNVKIYKRISKNIPMLNFSLLQYFCIDHFLHLFLHSFWLEENVEKK